MRSKPIPKAYLRGLEAVGAKPATPEHNQLLIKVNRIAQDFGAKLSEGGDKEKLHGIAQEKLNRLSREVAETNRQKAAMAAADFQAVQQKIERRYETQPQTRIADIMDAHARFSVMDKATVNVWANQVLSGELQPRSEYELLEALKAAPKHALRKEVEARGDFAAWTPEGKQALDALNRYATAGDKIVFDTEDGGRINADTTELFDVPEYSPAEILDRQHVYGEQVG